ncbi:alpha-amylase [Actinomadura fibrosa]|uniref:Glycosyl hydrolase family 13 catalytic domain-containing protein n=1 Tax=Actinomadura fibrosa TaxID=111802 RepID=A0ABW2XHW7_9ACTN|nr:alpha-amylase [Actinomadura fibrosa]
MTSPASARRVQREPVVYEVNTLVWLGEVERRHGRGAGLQDVPKEAWDELAVPGTDVVWLMGVWRRSPAGRAIALANAGLLASFREALPDVADADIAGSPYCVRDYVADERLGGEEGLAAARAELDRRGLGLYLDYVPNHVAPDHPWLADRPDCFVQGTEADLAADPAAFIQVDGRIYARGRDPFFPPWPDVVQLDAFAPEARAATAEALASIGDRCDGVRCDMAMLMMNDVFARTWGPRAGPPPAAEFWPEVLERVRDRHPDMTFMAEAYWDREWALQRQGFDLCYDKRLYDRITGGDAGAVRDHLRAGVDYQRGLVRFLENHDEPRAAAALGPARERAAAVLAAVLPGAVLWHEGQFEGRRVRVPVFLARRPDEPPDEAAREFHHRLLAAVRDGRLREGDWSLLDCSGWPDDPSYLGLVAMCRTSAEARHVAVVNLTDRPAHARIPLPWDDLRGRAWTLRDLLSGAVYERDGDELRDPGLYVELGPWGTHLLACAV